jgi:hypothetical protein
MSSHCGQNSEFVGAANGAGSPSVMGVTSVTFVVKIAYRGSLRSWPVGVDLLFIEQIRLDERHRKEGIGRNVVREIIETFGLQCGLVVCKPFPLEYSGWAEKYSAAQQAEPEFDRKKRRRLKVCDSSGKSQFHSTSGFRLLRSLSGDS